MPCKSGGPKIIKTKALEEKKLMLSGIMEHVQQIHQFYVSVHNKKPRDTPSSHYFHDKDLSLRPVKTRGLTHLNHACVKNLDLL